MKAADITFSGSCDDNYLEIRRGSESGHLVKKFCTGNLPTGQILTYSNTVSIKWVKVQDSSDSFTGVWTTSELTCCGKVALENHANSNGFYTLNTATGVYQADDTSNDYVVFKKTDGWYVGPNPSAGLKTLVRCWRGGRRVSSP